MNPKPENDIQKWMLYLYDTKVINSILEKKREKPKVDNLKYLSEYTYNPYVTSEIVPFD